MRAATIMLIATLIASAAVRGQAQAPAAEFTLTAFILGANDTVSRYDTPGTDDRQMLWFGVKNTTAVPYVLCTSWTSGLPTVSRSPDGGTVISEGAVRVNTNCYPQWIVLPGETHFEMLEVISLQDLDRVLTVSVGLNGKPVDSLDNLNRWALSWQGTLREAMALGEKMKANRQ